jgi:adenylylsulfate kinase-like enzyme
MNDKSKSITYKYQFNTNPHRGFFVAIEGLDGSGNSTQSLNVAQRLKNNGIKVVLT